ncbi:hypothetical protein DPMN_019083 [Dreissena polymorpha]|uniref:Uncharacterized protein n=1 Tax=Dreissena polymorpha TaxID=45954 RepID=A0A9D4NHS2_DREPO|nr:hypothetical protein DPMN_019083 [Dreissena polymorpha]
MFTGSRSDNMERRDSQYIDSCWLESCDCNCIQNKLNALIFGLSGKSRLCEKLDR